MDILTGFTVVIIIFAFVWMGYPQQFKEELMQWLAERFSTPVVTFILWTRKHKRKKVAMVSGVIPTRSKKTRQVRKYTNKSGVTFKVGDIVKLSKTAFTVKDLMPPTSLLGRRAVKGKITSLFNDVKDLVLVEPKLGGFSTWDVNDLELLEKLSK